MTTWSLSTHLVCLGSPSALHAPPLLLQSAALSPGLLSSSFSIILAHTKLAAHVFFKLVNLSLLF